MGPNRVANRRTEGHRKIMTHTQHARAPRSWGDKHRRKIYDEADAKDTAYIRQAISFQVLILDFLDNALYNPPIHALTRIVHHAALLPQPIRQLAQLPHDEIRNP